MIKWIIQSPSILDFFQKYLINKFSNSSKYTEQFKKANHVRRRCLPHSAPSARNLRQFWWMLPVERSWGRYGRPAGGPGYCAGGRWNKQRHRHPHARQTRRNTTGRPATEISNQRSAIFEPYISRLYNIQWDGCSVAMNERLNHAKIPIRNYLNNIVYYVIMNSLTKNQEVGGSGRICRPATKGKMKTDRFR